MTLAEAGALDPRGPVAEEIADLWWLMLGVGAAVFAVVVVLLGLALFRRRSAPAAGEEQLVRRWILVGGVVVPAVILLAVLVATVEAMREVPNDAPDDALSVEVIGFQFWWEVRYPDEDVVTANVMHIPVGRPVELQLTSADVIHSFWAPALAGKMDLLPDGTNTLVIEADEPGEYVNECAEFCGLAHALMEMLVVAEPEEQFAEWLAEQREPAAEPTTALAERGRDVFLAADCADCHTVRGTPAEGDDGPDLTHVASRPTLGAGTVPNTAENLARWVADPHELKEGVEMPAADLTDDELEAVVAYLEALE